MAKKIKVVGRQHGGNYFCQDVDNLHFTYDFNRCNYYLSYASDFSTFSKTYKKKPLCKFVNIGNNFQKSKIKKNKVKIDMLFPITNCVPLQESNRMPQYIISKYQLKIIEEIEKRSELKNIIKPFKYYGHHNFSHTEHLKKLKNSKIVTMNLQKFLKNYSPKLVVFEFISTPLFDVIPYDTDIFLILDPVHPFSKHALTLIKKRAFCFSSIITLQKAIREYDSDEIVKLRDTSFLKAYVNNGTKENLSKLNLDL